MEAGASRTIEVAIPAEKGVAASRMVMAEGHPDSRWAMAVKGRGSRASRVVRRWVKTEVASQLWSNALSNRYRRHSRPFTKADNSRVLFRNSRVLFRNSL